MARTAAQERRPAVAALAGILNRRMSSRVAVVVLTFNEERNLPACLDSVAGWAAQIFVVDSGSTETAMPARTAAAMTVDDQLVNST